MMCTLYLRVSVGISVLLRAKIKREEIGMGKILMQNKSSLQEVDQTLNSRQFGRCSRW